MSIEAEGPAFEAAIPSPEKENQEYGTGATTPQGESPYKRKKNSEMETPSPLPPPINEAQLIDQIQNGSLEFSPNSALEPQGENDCSGDSDTSDSTEVRNPSRDSSDGNVDEGSKPIPAISEQTVPEVSQFVEELPR